MGNELKFLEFPFLLRAISFFFHVFSLLPLELHVACQSQARDLPESSKRKFLRSIQSAGTQKDLTV